MTQIVHCDWLPQQERWSHLARLGLPDVFRKKNFPKIHYWPSFFGQDGWILASFFFCEFIDLGFILVHKHAKKNLANTQPSWPHPWSMTHVSKYLCQWRLALYFFLVLALKNDNGNMIIAKLQSIKPQLLKKTLQILSWKCIVLLLAVSNSFFLIQWGTY